MLYKSVFDNDELLKQHYQNFHKVDSSNPFYQKLFSNRQNYFAPKNYLRCDEFLATTKAKRIHDFLKHSYHCNSQDSDSLVNDFLNNFRSKFKTSSQVIMKCGFSLENLQPAPLETSALIVNLRYWSTGPYQTTFFNDYVFYSLKNDVLKRVTANGESRSSWRLKRFSYLNLKSANYRQQFYKKMIDI